MFQGSITAAQAIAAITNQNSLTSSTFTSSEEVLEAGLGGGGSATTSESQATAAAYHRIHEGAAGASSLRDVVSKDTQTSNINVRLAYHMTLLETKRITFSQSHICDECQTQSTQGGLIKTIPTTVPHHLYVSFKSAPI